MDLNSYQHKAMETAIYPLSQRETYPLLGLVGEVGEYANKYKKVIRDGAEFDLKDKRAELGDILWYVANLAADAGLSLNEIAAHNVEKLRSRQERGTLGGSGDTR